MVGRHTTQKWRQSGMHNVKSMEDMRTFQGRPMLTRAELDAHPEWALIPLKGLAQLLGT